MSSSPEVHKWLRLDVKKDPLWYLLSRLWLNDKQHRDINSDTSKRYARELLIDIAWAIPQDAPWDDFHDMGFHDKVNFCEVYLKHAKVRDFLTQRYQFDALHMQRIIMSITDELLDEWKVTWFELLALYLFLGDIIAKRYVAHTQTVLDIQNPEQIDFWIIGWLLRDRVHLAILSSSSFFAEKGSFPLQSLLAQTSPAFTDFLSQQGVLEAHVSKLVKEHSNKVEWWRQACEFKPWDFPEMLILNDQAKGIFGSQRIVTYHEMVAFRWLLAHSELLCADGIRSWLLGPGSMPLWYQLLGENPDLLAELQKFPKIPPDQLANRNPLRFALTKIFGGTFPASFFTITYRAPVSPFGIAGTARKIGDILKSVDGELYGIGTELERELATKNLRITNIINGHEEGDKKERDELCEKLKRRVEDIHHLLNMQDSSAAQWKIWTRQDQLDDEAAVRLATQQAEEALSARKRERGIELSLDNIRWLPGIKRRQLTSIDVSQCTIPPGCTYSLTCKAPKDTVPRILIEKQPFNAEREISWTPISDVYQAGNYVYCLVFHAPTGKEFEINITQKETTVTVQNVDAQLTPEQEEERRKAAEEYRRQWRERQEREEEERKKNESSGGGEKENWWTIEPTPEEKAREKYEQDMTALALTILNFTPENLPTLVEESDGVLCFDFTSHASLDWVGYELPPEYHQIRFSEKGGFSPEINGECQEMMRTIAVDFYREKKRKEDEKKNLKKIVWDNQPDPEYLAFREELQPIFDCLNAYRFSKTEKGATLSNPFPSLNESLEEFGANIYMSGDRSCITLHLRPKLPQTKKKKAAHISGNMNVFAALLQSDRPMTESGNINCTLLYDHHAQTMTRKIHGHSIPWMRLCWGVIPAEKLSDGQRRAMRDLELRLKELFIYYFATHTEKKDIERSEEESLMGCRQYQMAIGSGHARVIFLPKPVPQPEKEKSKPDETHNGNQLFPKNGDPKIQTSIGSISTLESIFEESEWDMVPYLLYAQEAIEFGGERKKSQDEKQREETKQHRLERLDSLMVSPRWRAMLKIRVRKTLDGVQDGAILKTSPAYATLKTCFSASQWKTKKGREVNDALLDQFIRNMRRDEVSVSYRRPIIKTLKQHQDTLQKIASQERMSA